MTSSVTAAQPTTYAQTSTAETQTEESTSAITSDFETFLKMLTVQMQNQDPLNPVDSADYAIQLATFSGVEQQVQTNDLLKSLGTQMGVMGMAQIAGWVGMEARTQAPVHYDGAPITLAPNPSSSADRTFLVVQDATGTVVQTQEIPNTRDYYEWDGLDENGAPLPDGNYSFTLENFAYDEYLSTTTVEAFGYVTEARAEGTDTVLVMEGGAEVSADAISALREPN
ncbi:flagellar basal-body rod modification protein FlgD [Pacificibacter maritimus]|uniref:Basal-body rod modification protein FlgD n=1 Tax=Pacificibacter maritimus TaxID=762213 RepID=A0A3N4U2B2_9RHOB|nr:flagellar hook capping FlgD N-terminal domain-containing protein [Pacificibacter maritimus]RPE64642.1 flagellar basal-body rod modification protein FlgD [Pacificibacter maritimus]